MFPQPTARLGLALTLVLQAVLILLSVVRGWLCLCLSLLPGKREGMGQHWHWVRGNGGMACGREGRDGTGRDGMGLDGMG